MSKNKREMLDEELKIRRWINKILIEENSRSFEDLNEEYTQGYYGGGSKSLVSVFVDPFKNAFKVAKVGIKDLASIAKMNFDMLFTLSPSKREKILDDYDARKEKIDAEWEKVMEPVNKTLESGTLPIASFLLNPTGFLGVRLAKKVASTGSSAKKILQDSGWWKESGKDFGGKGSASNKGDSNTVDVLGSAGKLVKDLAKIFFLAHHDRTGPLLSEANEESASDSSEVETGVLEYIKENPELKSALDKAAQEIYDAKKQQIDETVNTFMEQVKLVNSLASAQDLKSFLTAIDSANKSGVDVGGNGLQGFQKTIDAEVKKILSNPQSRSEFLKAYLEQSQSKTNSKNVDEKTPDVSDQQLTPGIEKVIFMNTKAKVQEQLTDGIREFKKKTKEDILRDTPPEKDWGLISKNPMGKKYIDMLNAAIKKVNDA